MKLEEVIEYFEDISEDLRLRGERAAGVDWKYATWCGERAEQNKQIADWLKDYKLLLEQEPITVETIDQYCKEHNYVLCERGTERKILDDIKAEIEDLEPEYDFEGFYKCQSEVLNIIDKHISGNMLVCPNCGLDVHSDFENCPRCGERMKNE